MIKLQHCMSLKRHSVFLINKKSMWRLTLFTTFNAIKLHVLLPRRSLLQFRHAFWTFNICSHSSELKDRLKWVFMVEATITSRHSLKRDSLRHYFWFEIFAASAHSMYNLCIKFAKSDFSFIFTYVFKKK